MSLELWLAKGWITEHKPTLSEISELLAIADRALKDCQLPGLSNEGKLDMAHNAVLQSATAALAAAGYRAGREAYHYHVINSLAFTLELKDNIIRKLNKFRKKRNISDYERTGTVTSQEAGELFELAKVIRQQVDLWISSNYPELYGTSG